MAGASASAAADDAERTWREKPTRSAEAKRRRHAKGKMKRRLRAAGDAGSGGQAAAFGGSSEAAGGGGDDEDGAGYSKDDEMRSMRRALHGSQADVKHLRKQLKREQNAVRKAKEQLGKRDSKAAKKAARKHDKKRDNQIAQAAKREERRLQKAAKRGLAAAPDEGLHSTDKKRRRLLETGVAAISGVSGSMPTSGRVAAGELAAQALAASVPPLSRDGGGAGSERPRGRPQTPGPGPDNMRPGDWICPRCNYHNFARNRTCGRRQRGGSCGAPKVGGPWGGGGGPSGRGGVGRTY